jgi:hypothetical protein
VAAAVVVLSLLLAEAVERLERVLRWVCREGGRVGEGVVAAAGRVERGERSSSASEERGVLPLELRVFCNEGQTKRHSLGKRETVCPPEGTL